MEVPAAAGQAPQFGNFYVLFWSLINVVVVVLLLFLLVYFVVHIIKYFKQKAAHEREFLTKIDRVIDLLEDNKDGRQSD